MKDPRKRAKGEPSATIAEIQAYEQYCEGIRTSVAQMKANYAARIANSAEPMNDVEEKQTYPFSSEDALSVVKSNMDDAPHHEIGIVAPFSQKTAKIS